MIKSNTMSWVRIWVHLVFATKNRVPLMNSKDLRLQIFSHIRENAKEKDIWLDCISGYHDHAHCLISLGKTQSISQVGKLLKGESSRWINKNKVTRTHFTWQDDFWAVGVSESHLTPVRSYIHNQEDHHRKMLFSEEVEQFMKKYGWDIIRGKE